MESPNGMVSRTDPGKRDEGDESEEMNSSASEDEEYESDSGREESTENESESDSEIARDFSIHQKVCPSVAKCAVYEEKLVEEKRRLRLRLKDMRAGCKELTEKRRALSIIKQTIHVESKIRNLENACARKTYILVSSILENLDHGNNILRTHDMDSLLSFSFLYSPK